MVDPQLWISLNEVVNSGNKWGVLMYEFENTLRETARALVAPNKGILAADESFSTIEKRFKTIDVASTTDRRRAYREIFFTTSGSSEFISGVILFDETIRQTSSEGQALYRCSPETGDHSRHQGRQGHYTLTLQPWREDH